ncbi:MAG: ATP-binding protein [Betaproteobacteria bacterium]
MASFVQEIALTSPVRIRVCGALEVLVGDRLVAVDALSRWHIRALLALLAGSVAMSMEREAVCDALWPDSDTSTARNRLYHTVMLLRRALSQEAGEQEWVFVSGGRVRLHPDVASDALLMRQLAVAADAQASARWLMQQEGPLQPFAPWLPDLPVVSALRVEIQSTWQEVIGHAVGNAAGHEDTPTSRRLFEHLLRLSPANEAIHCALMTLDLRAGRSHRVLRQFDACARMLAEHLGLKPSQQSIELARQAEARLLSAGGVGAQAVPRRARDLSLVGRAGVIEDVAAVLRERSMPVVTLVGICGVGKSRIARELARVVVSELEDGVVWINMKQRSNATGGAAGILQKIVDRVCDGAPMEVHDDASVRRFSGLIVVDDAECCDDLISVVAAVTDAAPTARWLVTSIRPVGLDGECCVPILPLPVPPEGATPAQLHANPAVQLLMRRAFPVEQLDSQRLAEIGELVRRLDGLPLALELAATRLPLRTAAEICAELDHDLRPLDSGPVDFEGYQQSMSMAFDHTVAGLSPNALVVYQVAAVPAGDFDLSLLARLSSALSGSADMAACVEELEQLGIVSRVSDDSLLPRWRMGHLPRLHAGQIARRSGLDLEPKDRHLAWITQVLSGYTAQSAGLSMETDALFDRLHPEIIAALRHAESGRSALLPLVVSGVGDYWILRGRFGSCQRWLEAACAEAEKVPAATRYRLLARLKIQQASMLLLQLHVVDAQALSSRALDAARATGDAALLGEAANLAVRALIESGRLSEAIDQASVWISHVGQVGDSVARPLRQSLRVARARSGRVLSTGMPLQSVHGPGVVATSDEPMSAVDALWTVVDEWDACYRLRLWAESLEHAHRSLRRTQVAKAAYLWVITETLAARSARAVDRLNEALQAAESAADRARQAGLSTLSATAALVVADILIRVGELDRAEGILSESAVVVMDPSSGVPLQANWHAAAGLLALARGKVSDATDRLLAIAGDAWLFEDTQILAAATELGVVICASTGHVERASRLHRLLECLDQRGFAPRVPLEQRWLRQQLRESNIERVGADLAADEIVPELTQQLGSLALVLASTRGDR